MNLSKETVKFIAIHFKVVVNGMQEVTSALLNKKKKKVI